MRLPTALGRDVDITVRAKLRDRAHGRIRVLGEAHAGGFDEKNSHRLSYPQMRCRHPEPSILRWSTP